MSIYQPTDQVKRIQSIIETLDQKAASVKVLEQNINQQKLALERELDALNNTRRQLAIEIRKLDGAFSTEASLTERLHKAS